MEKSDLVKLKREVLDLGPEAALPQHLPDSWLASLSRDLDFILDDLSDDHAYMTAPLALIVHILMAQSGNSDSVSCTQEAILRYMHELRREITLEIYRRHTNLGTEPAATLETIFTEPKRSY